MVVVAIPTIIERGDAWKEVAEMWEALSPEVTVVPSWRKGTWAAGLNEVWESHKGLFVCASDDMAPLPGWYQAVEPWLEKGIVAPQVHDPRFSKWDPGTPDGFETEMSSFPIIGESFLGAIFPLPEELHYFTDDLISLRARQAGIPTIAVPSCEIVHCPDLRGRGAGMSEKDRMDHDRKLYESLTAP